MMFIYIAHNIQDTNALCALKDIDKYIEKIRIVIIEDEL